MSSYIASNLPEAQRLSSTGDDHLQSSASPFFARQDSNGKPRIWHGTTKADTGSMSILPINSKDGILSDRQNVKNGHSDASEDTSTRSTIGTNRICCLVIYAIVVYIFGILTGRLLEMSDAWLPRPASLRATGSLPKVTLGAYYYPWHADDFHRGYGYLRESLDQKPLLGEYDDRDPKVIAQHLEWSERANIGLWVTSWWGPNTREDNMTGEAILTHPGLEDHKIALFYETFGRILEHEDYSLHRVEPDVEFMCSNYFSHPNYFRIDNKPVVYVYLTRLLEDLGNLQQVLKLMRQTAKATCGKEIYII